MTEVSHPSLLLIEVREAIASSGLRVPEISALTGVPLRTIYNLLADDGMLSNKSTFRDLARGLSCVSATVAFWQKKGHPVGDACVTYWMALHSSLAPTSRRGRELARRANGQHAEETPREKCFSSESS